MKSNFALFLFLLLISETYSQDLRDTLQFTPITDTNIVKDTVISESVTDAIVDYSAKDSAIFDIQNRKLYLYGDAELKYKEFTLKAARIIFYKDNATIEAFGIPDSSGSGKYIGQPIFFEGSKRYDAFRLKYNFRTRKGNIIMGSTEIEGGYYLGEKIKKVTDDVYFIQNGSYTTCDKASPDYYFGSPKMKVLQKDKVIAEPVYLYVDDVPVFAIPFGIFPNHSGRSSGIIPPAYGEDATYGRYLAHLGYFWAINDYMDIALQGNYFTKGRVDLSGRYRYVLRYKFSGSLDIGGSRIRLGEEADIDRNYSDQWAISWYHNQGWDPTTTIMANLNFLSSKQYYNNSTNNLNDLLLQNAISNFTINKYWEGTPNSVSLNYYRDQNLQTGEVTERIPSISFLRSQTFPFRTKNTSLLELKWYEMISYDYTSQLLNIHTKTIPSGSTDFVNNTRGGLKQSIRLSAPVKVTEFNISPFFNYNEVWYDKYIEKSYNMSDSSVITNELTGFKTFRYFDMGISFNSRIIGIFNTDFIGIKGFRHTITPSITYTFRPDFSKPYWNTYSTYTDAAGNEIKYSYFEKEVFGSAPMGEVQGLTFAIGNIFEMKVKETDSTFNKFQILNLNGGISYNFVADSLNLSELGINYRTSIGNYLNIGGATSFNFYKYVDGAGRVNQFLWHTDRRLADLTSFNINLSTTIAASSEQDQDTVSNDEADEQQDDYVGIYNDEPVDFSIPWSLSLNYNYGITKPNPSVINKISNISGNFSFSLTKNWKFTFTAGYDIFREQISAPYITVYRDLHCWEMSLNWIPLGVYRGFKFELRVKAPQLQDVKVTKQTNYRGVY